MANWKIGADQLLDRLMQRGQFLTLRNITYDPRLCVVTLDVVGSDLPAGDGEVVILVENDGRSELVPTK